MPLLVLSDDEVQQLQALNCTHCLALVAQIGEAFSEGVAGQDMVTAAMKAAFVIQAPKQVRSHWQRVTEMLRNQFPAAVLVMDAARDDVLAFLHFPQEHWRRIWSTNPVERLNVEPRGSLGSAVIKRRTNVVGIFPNDAAFVRLVGSQLLEQ